MDDYYLPPDLEEIFLNTPASFPPPGVEANFENPPSRAFQGNLDGAISLTLASLAFFMRTYTRLFVIRQFSAEDYILLFAYCSSVALAGDGFYIVAHGLYQQWDLHVRDIIFYLYNVRIYIILHGICVAATKVVILMQYLRIFVPSREKGYMYWGCHICIWLNVALYSVNVFVIIFACRPPQMTYNPIIYVYQDRTPDICINIFQYLVSLSAINLALDVVMLLLPQRAIWKLTISKKRRLGISAMFSMGLIACVASILRLYYAIRTLDYPDNRIGNLNELGIWMAPEVTCGILIACLPVAPRFYQSLRDKSLRSLRTLVGSSTSPDTTKRTSHLTLSNRSRPDRHAKSGNDDDPTSYQSSEKRQRLESFNGYSMRDDNENEVIDLSTLGGSPMSIVHAQYPGHNVRYSIARGAFLGESSDDNDPESRSESFGNTDIQRVSEESRMSEEASGVSEVSRISREPRVPEDPTVSEETV